MVGQPEGLEGQPVDPDPAGLCASRSVFADSLYSHVPVHYASVLAAAPAPVHSCTCMPVTVTRNSATTMVHWNPLCTGAVHVQHGQWQS